MQGDSNEYPIYKGSSEDKPYLHQNLSSEIPLNIWYYVNLC